LGLPVQEQSVKHRHIFNSLLALIPLLLMGCGGGGTGSAQNAVSTPPPVVAPFVELKFAYEAHRFATKDVVPAYTYAGVTYPGGVADVFPQGSLSIDFEGDRYPEVVIPLNKAYGTQILISEATRRAIIQRVRHTLVRAAQKERGGDVWLPAACSLKAGEP
jgi:hypothetical protein